MIFAINKQCTLEKIIYTRVSDEEVIKANYDNDRNKKKEKIINIRKIVHNRRSHRDVQDFFEEMILNYGYSEYKTE